MKFFLTILFLSGLALAQSPLTTLGAGPGVVSGGGGATVAVLQRRNASSTLTNATTTTVNSCPTNAYCMSYGSGAQAGNTFIGWVRYSNGSSISSVADDKSDTCAVADTANDATNSVKVSMWYCQNLTAAARVITITFGGATSQISAAGIETDNIFNSSPLDTHTVNTGSSTSLTAGSVTPSATNYFLCQIGARTQTPKPTSFGVGVAQAYTVGSQANITWLFQVSDAVDGTAMQCGNYTSTSSINPTFTTSSSTGFASVAAFFKTQTAGAARPAGMYLAGVCEANEPSGPATIHLQCPMEGNTIVNMHGFGGDFYTTSSISDSASNSYTHSTIGSLGAAGSGKSDRYWVNNSTGGNAWLQDIVTTGTASDYSVYVLDFVGGATTSFVQESGTTESAVLPYNVMYTNGTGATDGYVLLDVQVNSNTCQSISAPSGALSLATLYGGEDESGGGSHPPSENNCWILFKFASGTAQLTWTPGFATATNPGSVAWHITSFASSGATVTGSTAAKAADSGTHANGSINDAKQWTNENGKVEWKYVSNTMQPNSVSSDGGSIYIGTTFGANQACKFKISAISGGTSSGGQGGGCLLRAATGARTENRAVVNAAASSNIQIGKYSAGSFSIVSGGTCSATTTPAANDIFQVEVTGTSTTSFTVKQNGSTVSGCTPSDSSSPITSGQPGLGFSSSMTTFSMVDWSAYTP